jgi:hypothetical protein
MGSPNFSKKETVDLFDWIQSSEDDSEYFRMLVRFWTERMGGTEEAKYFVHEQLVEYATLKEPGHTEFKFHNFATDYIKNADLREITDYFFELWGGPPCRRVLVGKRIGGEQKVAVEDLSGQDLIHGREVVVTDNYGEELFRFARDLMRIQAEAVRCLQ